MKVTFDKKWFNPLFFILNDIIKIKTIRTVLVYGGKSSSKTVSIAQILSKESVVRGASSISLRKESATIPTTLKKTFNLAVETTRLWPVFQIQDRRYLCDNNSEMVLKGLDSEDKAKGVESYKYLYLDELDQFEENEFRQFNLSLRGMPDQKIFGSWNPVNENSWVKIGLIDTQEWLDTEWKLPCEDSFVRISADGTTILIKTTYQDNFWIVGSPCGTYGFRDEAIIAEYEKLRTTNYNSYRVNVLGEWGKTNYGGEILKCWRSELHTGVFPYNSDQAIWLSLDENTVPYFPCGLFQVGADVKTPRMIKNIALVSPDNRVPKMIAEIERMLTIYKHEGALFITGDATSQKDDVKQEKGHDLFRQIIDGLTKWNPRRVIPKSNPSVIKSTEFFNSILDVKAEGIDFKVDKECRKAIIDFENTKEDKNGKVDKKTVTNPVTKVSYQPYGHFFDLTRYFICTAFANEYLNYQRSGVGKTIKSSPSLNKSNSY